MPGPKVIKLLSMHFTILLESLNGNTLERTIRKAVWTKSSDHNLSINFLPKFSFIVFSNWRRILYVQALFFFFFRGKISAPLKTSLAAVSHTINWKKNLNLLKQIKQRKDWCKWTCIGKKTASTHRIMLFEVGNAFYPFFSFYI